jgi:beta-glucosidase
LGDCSGLVRACTTGEFRDTASLDLPGNQQALAEAVLALGKPVILVLVNGRPYAIPKLVEQVNAVVEDWLPGEEGGYAVADVLFGKVNPGGKLPITFPRSIGQVPLFYNHKPSGNKSHMYTDYVSLPVTPLFPFGHGLSYTTFAYADLRISKPKVSANQTVEITCKVTNTGSLAGDEIVQLYIRDEYATLPRPMKELKGYCRVKLAPGESQKLTFTLAVNQLAYYSLQKELMVEAGKILVMLGSSSEDIRLNGEFEIIGEKQVVIQDRVFVCPVVCEPIKG